MSVLNLFSLFLFFFFIHELWETFLNLLNQREIKKNQHQVPEFYKENIDLGTYQKSTAYNLSRLRFSLLSGWISNLIILALLFFGFFHRVELFLQNHLVSQSLTFAVAYCLCVGAVFSLLSLPASLYSQFVIEEKFGFNKMTFGLWMKDLLKGATLSLVLGVPILYALFLFYGKTGSAWWIWAFLSLFAFQLLLAAVYPSFIAPLFNKFTPLEEGSLKEAIFAIARKINFKMSGIFTLDGSKRSSHSNAYFAGIGKFRRIVLFDTLRQQMNEPEIISVLAHEMGHNKKKHILKQLILGFFMTGIGFFVLAQLMKWPELYDIFRAGPAAAYKALVLFSLFAGHFTFMLTPLSNYLSRKYEYEADAFSVNATGEKENMKNALLKLSKENLSNLTPHPWYSFYYYSHPTTLERVKAIESMPNKKLA
ncbi:MAG: M48 family metallopeptidase [Deltaproteobacteria bacterium]|nr:M48 family metallopeptidase [Deltaproteobacteria bacterium]